MDRIISPKSGGWATVSQDLLVVAAKLFRLSEEEASLRTDKNYSCFVYGGIPLLLAALHSFAIEYEGIGTVRPLPREVSASSLPQLMESRYGVSGNLLEDLQTLCEIRNEIIHPHPLPPGTPDNWPDYLRQVKEKGLLHTSGNPSADYVMLSQIASHKLFAWAVEVTENIYAKIVNFNPAKTQHFQRFLTSNFKALFRTG